MNVEELVSALTLEEKAGLCSLCFRSLCAF